MSKLDVIEAIESARPRVVELLGDSGKAALYTRLALLALDRKPSLGRCTPQSWIAGLLLSARLRLPIDSHQALLIPSLEQDSDTGACELGLTPGYGAFVELLEREGRVSFVEAHEVRERDFFRLGRGLASWPLGRRIITAIGLDSAVLHIEGAGDRGPVVAVYALARFKDGTTKIEVMRRPDIDAVNASERSDPESARNWGNRNGIEIQKAIAVKRLCKTLARSPELRAAIYLARLAEDCRYSPRVADVLGSLGIEAPAGQWRLVGVIPISSPAAPGRCCMCGNLDEALTTESLDIRVLVGFRCAGCGAPGTQHDLCPSCLRDYRKAVSEAGAKQLAEQGKKKQRAKKNGVQHAADPFPPSGDAGPPALRSTASAGPPVVESETETTPAAPSPPLGVTPPGPSPSTVSEEVPALASASETTDSSETTHPRSVLIDSEESGNSKGSDSSGSSEPGSEPAASAIGMEPSEAAPSKDVRVYSIDEVLFVIGPGNREVAQEFLDLINDPDDWDCEFPVTVEVGKLAARSRGAKSVDAAWRKVGGTVVKNRREPLTSNQARAFFEALRNGVALEATPWLP